MADALRSDLAHLYRRAGFGATASELDAAQARGYAATVRALVVASSADDAGVAATAPPSFGPPDAPSGTLTAAQRQQRNARDAAQARELMLWWLQRMAAAVNPFPEKLAFFWHGHFATGISKVRSAALMLRQNELFRERGLGQFDALDLAVAQDPAMMRWLDTAADIASHPNENFARENMELFTLGHGNYTEDDVREAARCYTGWRYNIHTDLFEEISWLHDNGTKTVLGNTGNFDGTDVVRICTHAEVSHAWVVARVWSRFARTITPDAAPGDLVVAYAPTLSLSALFTAMFNSAAFLQTKGQLVKQPVEYVVGALRALRVRPADRHLGVLRNLGQLPFDPPNVGGWPADDAWLTTAASLTRLQFAQDLARVGDISLVEQEPPATRADAAAQLLSVDGWGAQTRVALAQVSADPRAVVALALCAPESVVN
jgi:uncharacterized protein (DUF1800 family)